MKKNRERNNKIKKIVKINLINSKNIKHALRKL